MAVVELVARGGTNREVADQLYLSPHTINAHSAMSSPSWGSAPGSNSLGWQSNDQPSGSDIDDHTPGADGPAIGLPRLDRRPH